MTNARKQILPLILPYLRFFAQILRTTTEKENIHIVGNMSELIFLYLHVTQKSERQVTLVIKIPKFICFLVVPGEK